MMTADPFVALRHRFTAGVGLEFDEQYRAAQLPLIAPEHSRVLSTLSGRDYVDGRYERPRTSLVADVASSLSGHSVLRTLCDRLHETSFADKIAFDALTERIDTLHATIVGDVPFVAAEHSVAARAIAGEVGVLCPRLHGPFIGGFNVGRIYLPLEFVEPREVRAIDEWNGMFGKPRPRLLAVGVINLSDELSAQEAHDLGRLISGWDIAPTPIRVEQLSWTRTHDDLTLSSRRLETLELKDGLL